MNFSRVLNPLKPVLIERRLNLKTLNIILSGTPIFTNSSRTCKSRLKNGCHKLFLKIKDELQVVF